MKTCRNMKATSPSLMQLIRIFGTGTMVKMSALFRINANAEIVMHFLRPVQFSLPCQLPTTSKLNSTQFNKLPPAQTLTATMVATEVPHQTALITFSLTQSYQPLFTPLTQVLELALRVWPKINQIGSQKRTYLPGKHIRG
jgi:hypothetical protein